jgi:uncharacterized protein with PIN domain
MTPQRHSAKGGAQRSAVFHFHGKLTDFLPPESPSSFPYTFRSTPTIKHAVEAIGVPHPEVGRVLVHGREVGFSYQLQQGDVIEVFPVEGNWLHNESPLRRRYRGTPRFVLDVHLGTLTRRLRLLGFDSLTRDIGMLMWCDVHYGCWVRSQNPSQQVVEVLEHFSLRPWIRPFHRCTVCNGLIESIEREEAKREVKPEIFELYQNFYRCRSCRRIYWKGTHFQRMERLISSYTDSFD